MDFKVYASMVLAISCLLNRGPKTLTKTLTETERNPGSFRLFSGVGEP